MDTTVNLQAGTFNHPLLRELNELSLRCCGVSFRIVYPTEDHWEQMIPGKIKLQPFCAQIKSTEEGRKKCRTNHVMMGIAACRGGMLEHRCHSGALILVHPLPDCGSGVVAIVSSCIASIGDRQTNWAEARKEGRALGLDLRRLKKAHASLPDLEDNGALAREFLKMAADIIHELQMETYLETRLEDALSSRSRPQNVNRVLIEKIMAPKEPAPKKKQPAFAPANKMGKLIQITADLIREQPHMPYSVEEVAESLRVSPNHFSTEFRQHTGMCFSDFITEQRLEYSKTLLSDIMLNIEEVALKAGYTDASYYARKFKQRNGMTPSQWRTKNKIVC